MADFNFKWHPNFKIQNVALYYKITAASLSQRNPAAQIEYGSTSSDPDLQPSLSNRVATAYDV